MLEDLVGKSVYILRETKAQFKNPCVLWSTGKDSTVMLSLCREAFSVVPFPVVHIDTGFKFKEIYEFRDKIAEEWNLDLIVAKSPNAGKSNPQTSNIDHHTCCTQLKTTVLREVIEKNNFDAVIVSIRRDEHYMRNYERVSSPRDKDFKWNILREKQAEAGDAPYESLQDTELWDLYESDFGQNVHHIRRHPILHWTEPDVWEYVKARNLPVNPLYFADYVGKTYGLKNKRFRSLGCTPCTSPVDSSASTIDEIVEELRTTKIPERSGRAQDKENEVMRKLRSLGYM